jgi:hypothetical protein
MRHTAGTSSIRTRVNPPLLARRGSPPEGQFLEGPTGLPYSLQLNIGVQHEIKPGTVVSVDYIYNHGVGLPILVKDMGGRRDGEFPTPIHGTTPSS